MSETLGLSIIIPVFNAEKYLLKCINSILEQNIHTSYEIILIDDASTDESLNIIKTINSPYKDTITSIEQRPWFCKKCRA